MNMGGDSTTMGNMKGSGDGGMGEMGGMSMTFNFDTPVTVLFNGWVIDNSSKMIGSCFGIIGMAILYEVMKRLRVVYASSYYPRNGSSPVIDDDCCDAGGVFPISQENPSQSSDFSLFEFWTYHIMNTFWHALMVILGYFLMLIVMTYNVWLCISVVIGLCVGFLINGFIELALNSTKKRVTPTAKDNLVTSTKQKTYSNGGYNPDHDF